ncbi:hypothetical protein GGX14DRAFT_391863 [Mycena pura]|uniref:Uncharacterized protein n=1 Tax=Mycena pura TaxID=153505 RepID=A0AAD6VNH7_9AGAR|nr:hypothetical protein GGX14DRAFT_391863 [Mycena pura]
MLLELPFELLALALGVSTVCLGVNTATLGMHDAAAPTAPPCPAPGLVTVSLFLEKQRTCQARAPHVRESNRCNARRCGDVCGAAPTGAHRAPARDAQQLANEHSVVEGGTRTHDNASARHPLAASSAVDGHLGDRRPSMLLLITGYYPTLEKPFKFMEMGDKNHKIHATYNFAPTFCRFVPGYAADMLHKDYHEIRSTYLHNRIEHDASLTPNAAPKRATNPDFTFDAIHKVFGSSSSSLTPYGCMHASPRGAFAAASQTISAARSLSPRPRAQDSLWRVDRGIAHQRRGPD